MSVVQVAAGVIIRGDRLLACQRRAESSHPLQWEFPGGKWEPSESLAGCTRRELHEELGIDAVVGEELWRTRHRYHPDRAVDLFFFLITAFRGEPKNQAFASIRWVRRGQLHTLDFLEADRGLVAFLDAVRWAPPTVR